MAIKWTAMYQGDRDAKDKTPNVHVAEIGGMRLSLTNAHIHYRGKWVMSFEPLVKTTELLDCSGPAEAKQRAINIARAKLAPVFKALDSAATTAFPDKEGR